jgi:import receptor subunit TOM70
VYNDGTSVDELNQLIGEGTQDADLYMRRGWAYLRKRDYEEAMEEFSRAAEIGEGKRPAEMYHMRGTFHYLMRRFEEAMLDYNRALDLEPSNVQVLLKRAGLKLEQRDAEGCTADLALAERVGEDDSDLYYQRGQMRFLSEDILGAIQDYRRACDLGHDSVLARIQLAIALWRAQEIDEALKLFDQVRKENPDNADVHNFLGEIFMAEGDFNAARESFEKANELDPESPMSLVNLGLLAFRRSMAMNPAAMMAAGGAGAAGLMGADLGGLGFGGAGNSREELEEVEKARKYLSDALAVDPKFDMAQAHLAQVHMRQERVDLALECYAATVELARTEDELLNAVMCRLAAQAQLDAAKRLPK